jgi:hypothetical protein
VFICSPCSNKSECLYHFVKQLKQVHAKHTLITPAQCKSLWKQFKSETEFTITQAVTAQVCISCISFIFDSVCTTIQRYCASMVFISFEEPCKGDALALRSKEF